MVNLPDNLMEFIKDIISSDPLELYDDSEGTILESNYELVNSRFEEDRLEEEDRYIGSANLMMASATFGYIYLGKKTVSDLSDEEIEQIGSAWTSIMETLVNTKFLRSTSVKENIRLVINNT